MPVTNSRLASALLATALSAGLAHAQADSSLANTSWTTQFEYAQNGFPNSSITNNTLNITATGTYQLFIRVGIFNLTGQSNQQSNQGLSELAATINATGLKPGESLGVDQVNSRFAPFNAGPATSFGGTLSPNGPSITGIDCARDLTGVAKAPWLWDSTTNQPAAMPTAPADSNLGLFAPRGINSYANVYRYSVTVTSLIGPNIVLSLAGQAAPVLQWPVLSSTPPTSSTPGLVSFTGLAPSLLACNAPSLTLVRVAPCTPTVSITAGPVPQTINVGAPVFFAVTTSQTSASCQWRRNGIALSGSTRISGVTSPVLTIFPAAAADAGTYDVVITDPNGQAPCNVVTSTAALLRVLCPVDADRNGLIQPADVGVFISDFFTALTSDGC